VITAQPAEPEKPDMCSIIGELEGNSGGFRALDLAERHMERCIRIGGCLLKGRLGLRENRVSFRDTGMHTVSIELVLLHKLPQLPQSLGSVHGLHVSSS
jgi:hypothetical protein